MKHRRINYCHLTALILYIVSFALLLVTPKLNALANLDRVKFGLGGECLIWLVVGLIAMLIQSLGDEI